MDCLHIVHLWVSVHFLHEEAPWSNALSTDCGQIMNQDFTFSLLAWIWRNSKGLEELNNACLFRFFCGTFTLEISPSFFPQPWRYLMHETFLTWPREGEGQKFLGFFIFSGTNYKGSSSVICFSPSFKLKYLTCKVQSWGGMLSNLLVRHMLLGNATSPDFLAAFVVRYSYVKV